jgi:hypothetical protein
LALPSRRRFSNSLESDLAFDGSPHADPLFCSKSEITARAGNLVVTLGKDLPELPVLGNGQTSDPDNRMCYGWSSQRMVHVVDGLDVFPAGRDALAGDGSS